MTPNIKTEEQKSTEAARELKLTRPLPLALTLPAGKRKLLRQLLRTIDEKRARKAA